MCALSLSDRDRRLAAQLKSARRIDIEEMRSGVRISSRSWIGVVQFEAFEIHVVPKLAGDTLGVAKMLDFTYGIERLRRTAGVQSLAAQEDSSLLELLSLLLLEEAERVVRGGFVAEYREHEEELSVVRGRLLVDRQVLVRFGQVDRVICRFDELEHDTDENRLLGIALLACARRVRRVQLHRRLRALASVFQELCDPESIDLESVRATLTYDRKNAHYREAHGLAWLILDAMGVEDVFALSAPTKCFAFMLDMNVLFEDFITRLVGRLFPAPAFSVESQERNRSVLWSVSKQAPYGSIRPDIVIRSSTTPDSAVAIDAKYKRYDVSDVSNADIYQGLLYAQAYGSSGVARSSVAVIVHPTEKHETQVERIVLRRPGRLNVAELIVVGLPVRATLDCLELGTPSPAEVLRTGVLEALSKSVSGSQPVSQ